MPDEKSNHPLLLKLRLKLGKRFGQEFEPDGNVRVIYHMGLYAGVRGPGVYNYNPSTETLGPQIYVGGQRRDYTFTDLLSADGLPMTVQINVLVKYDPRLAPNSAALLTRAGTDVRLGLVKTFTAWATRIAINKRNSLELRQGTTLEMIELEVKAALKDDMNPLGFEFPFERPVRVLNVLPPDKLTDRHVDDAQRRAHIVASEEFNPTDYRRVLIAEFMKDLAQSGRGESIINFSELIDAYSATPDRSAASRPRIVDQTAAPQPPPDQPPASNPPPQQQPSSPRPGKRSRLE